MYSWLAFPENTVCLAQTIQRVGKSDFKDKKIYLTIFELTIFNNLPAPAIVRHFTIHKYILFRPKKQELHFQVYREIVPYFYLMRGTYNVPLFCQHLAITF